MTPPLRMTHLIRIILTALILCPALWSQAKVSLPSVISSKMVLQQQSQANLWGWADAGQQVAITSSWGAKATAVADSTGRWQTSIATPEATSTAQTLTFKSRRSKITLTDILIGEVWLVGGQSNMDFPVADHTATEWWQTGSVDADTVLANARQPRMRLFRVDHNIAPIEARSDCQAVWTEADPETVSHFSAVGYAFGRTLADTLDIPIGLIQSTLGATHCEAWIPTEVIESDPHFAEVVSLHGLGGTDTRRPQFVPGCMWRGMTATVCPYTLRGIAWYQCEGNAPRPHTYAHALVSLIDSYRQKWGNPQLPFYYVQAAPLASPLVPNPHLIREIQAEVAQTLPAVGMTVITDLGDSLDVHPRQKTPVGRRLARWPLSQLYGHTHLAAQGPVFSHASVSADTITAHFLPFAGALATLDGHPLKGFEVAGPDGIFHPASAFISGSEVKATSPSVKHPMAIRMGYAPYKPTNLSAGGVPASPFRSDRWPQTK